MNRYPQILLLIPTLLLVGCSPFPEETRNIKRYVASKSVWPDHLVSHFPTERPDDSQKPIFSFFPGFLQGGAWIQLRVEVTSSDIELLKTELENETEHVYQGGSFFSHYNDDQENNLPTATFHTNRTGKDPYEFPDHFTLYVLHADDRGGGWNHGETSGIALSEKTSEVIYWAEDW